MEHSSGIQASLSGRYASALFALAHEEKKIPVVEKDLSALASLVSENSDNYSETLDSLLTSQVIGRSAAKAAMAGLAESMKLNALTANFLGVLAENGRLAELSAMIRAFHGLAADHRGEVTAEVTSAYPLTQTQRDAIAKNLKSRAGREVIISEHVDPDILGGLIVRMGSQMIDGSIKTRLNTLSQAMKG
ncbi:MAG: F0F1 ATP synthase subunit delta [Pseudomonadota bacterium]